MIINAEILPVLQNKYSSVYGDIIKYNQRIDVTSNIEQLKQIKEEIAFKYNIPNRQYLSDKIERKIKGIAVQQKEFVLEKEDFLSNVELFNCISRVAPEIDLTISDLEKAKEIVSQIQEERENVIKIWCPRCGSEDVEPIEGGMKKSTYWKRVAILLLTLTLVWFFFYQITPILTICLIVIITVLGLIYLPKNQYYFHCKQCGKKF